MTIYIYIYINTIYSLWIVPFKSSYRLNLYHTYVYIYIDMYTHTHTHTHTHIHVIHDSIQYIQTYIHIGGVRSVMVTIVGNGHGDMRSNTERDYFLFT